MIKNFFNKYKEIISYVFFGVLATVVSWGSYYIFVNKLSLSVGIGNILSWVCAVAFAYFTNKLWVFESKSWKFTVVIKEIFNFLLARVGTGVLQWVGVPLLSDKTGFDEFFMRIAESVGLKMDFLFTEGIYSKIVVEVIVVVLNYFFSKFLIFKKKKPDEAAEKEK